MRQHTVFLIPSDDLGWNALRAALQTMADVAIIGETTDVSQVPTALGADAPDVLLAATVVSDVPTRDFLLDVRRTCWPESRVLVFAVHFDPADVPILSRVRLAAYFIWEDLNSETIGPTLMLALKSPICMGSPVAAEAFTRAGWHSDTSALLEGVDPDALTPRQREVARLDAEGLTNREIAARLSISPGTVKKHLDDIRKRLHEHN